jgi:hypothetical protein
MLVSPTTVITGASATPAGPYSGRNSSALVCSSSPCRCPPPIEITRLSGSSSAVEWYIRGRCAASSAVHPHASSQISGCSVAMHALFAGSQDVPPPLQCTTAPQVCIGFSGHGITHFSSGPQVEPGGHWWSPSGHGDPHASSSARSSQTTSPRSGQ